MRYPRLVSLSILVFAVSLVLSGCGSTQIAMSSNSAAPTGTPPTVVGAAEQVEGVAPNRKQEVRFSEAMDASTINAQSFQVADSSGKLAQGTVSYDPYFETASFLPNPALQTGATYTATITTAVASTGGMHLASPYSYTFNTRSDSDTSPLIVNSVVPAANATCVSATAPITITFDEAPDSSTVNSANIVVTGPGGAVLPVTMSINVTTTQVVLTPKSALPSGTITVTVKNVGDLADVMMAAPFTWSFSTTCSQNSAVAFVYIAGGPGGTSSQITAYAADANGQLTPVPGSPFKENVSSMAANGKYLMVSTELVPDINSYAIESDGALTLAGQTDYSQYGCATSNAALTFDRTGNSLYADEECSGNLVVASFAVDSSSGNLSYLGGINGGYRTGNVSTSSFLGNDVYAYSPFTDCMYGNILTFQRSSSGLLGFANPTITQPAPPPGSTGGYIADRSAADLTNHVVFGELPCFGPGASPVQLASYTADGNGNLTTTNTYATMPATSIMQGPFGELKISPSDTLLAVGGYGGLQVFHFNGANPITSYTGLLTTDQISAIAWDNNNHLYAITSTLYASNTPVTNPNKLYVFTVTDTAVTPAPGSPYMIEFPFRLAVQPKQ
jgi:hypothetical protein